MNATPSHAAILDRTGMPYSDLRTVCEPLSILAITVSGENALTAWETLRDLIPQTGCWPLMTGGKQRFQKGIVFISEVTDFPSRERLKAILQGAEGVDFEAFYQERREHFREVVEYEDEDEEPLDFETELREVEGEWPEESPSPITFGLHLDPMPDDWKNRKPSPEVEIMLIPTTNCWELPAFLDCGGWNECPQTEIHVAMFRQWHERFGAEIIGIADDRTEMRVARPPKTHEEAETLA